MASKDELKRLVYSEIDARAERIVRVSHTIMENPEPGFREVKTSALVASELQELGVPFRGGIALTGIKGELRGGAGGPSVAIMGELDSLIVRDHPHADSDTGAAHACGHHAQIGMLLGATMGLMAPGVLPGSRRAGYCSSRCPPRSTSRSNTETHFAGRAGSSSSAASPSSSGLESWTTWI